MIKSIIEKNTNYSNTKNLTLANIVKFKLKEVLRIRSITTFCGTEKTKISKNNMVNVQINCE